MRVRAVPVPGAGDNINQVRVLRFPAQLAADLFRRGHQARSVTGLQLANAVAGMRALTRSMIAATDAYDVVLTPTLAQLPALVGGIRDDADPAADFEAQKRFTPFTSPYNVSGQPAVTVPLSWPVVDGVVLPVGVQLVGRPGDERTPIALAGQLERARPWAHRRPPVWDLTATGA